VKNVYKDPIKAIHKATRAGDYDALSDALDLAYNSGGRSATEKSAIVFGYDVLTGAWSDESPTDVLISYERMRQLNKSDTNILKRELEFLQSFSVNRLPGLEIDSISMIFKIMEFICDNVPDSFQKNAKTIKNSIIATLPDPIDNSEKSHEDYHIVQSMAKLLFSEISSKVEANSSVEYYCADCELFYFDGVHDFTSDYLQLAYTKSSVKCPDCGNTSGKYISQQEFADKTGLSINTVRKWTSSGKLHKTYFGRAVRIPESEIERVAIHVPSIYE